MGGSGGFSVGCEAWTGAVEALGFTCFEDTMDPIIERQRGELRQKVPWCPERLPSGLPNLAFVCSQGLPVE